MGKPDLTELTKLARPALQHAELVDLARTHSPSKAFEIATARWPQRQAKAARSLAQLRRDHPRAFEALTAEGHARSASADTEHAHERTEHMSAHLLKSLARLSNPVARFEVALKHGLKEYLAREVATMTAEWNAVFWCDRPHGTVFFDTIPDVPDTYTDTRRPETLEWRQKHQNRVFVVFAKPGKEPVGITIDLDGMIAYFGWDKPTIEKFVRSILAKTITEDPKREGWRLHHATTKVCRTHLIADDPLAKAVERWSLLSQFRGGRIFELRTSALPVPVQRKHPTQEHTEHEIRRELDPIVARMRELGMTPKEIWTEFIRWIIEKGPTCRHGFMLAVAGSSCFDGDKEALAARSDALRKYYLPTIRKETDIFLATQAYVWLDYHDAHIWFSGDSKFLRPRLIRLLSEGNAGLVFQWIKTFAWRFSYLSTTNRRVESPALFAEFAKEAITLAVKSEQYGVAAALAQHFPRSLADKEAREYALLALDLHQPIALAWESSIEKRDLKSD